jgi:hypothetical protein
MPEYLFFHELSKQGILLWPEYNEMLRNSPYCLENEWLFDEATLEDNSSKEPSTFLWILSPKKEV